MLRRFFVALFFGVCCAIIAKPQSADKRAVDGDVRVSPDRGREVRIGAQVQAEVADIVGRVHRLRLRPQHDFVDEGLQIDLVVGETPNVALAGIAQRAFRAALPAPVERRHRKAPRAQIADGLEVFLDELGAALKQADGSLAPRRRRPAGIAKFDPVAGLEGAGHRPFGHRIGGNIDQGH